MFVSVLLSLALAELSAEYSAPVRSGSLDMPRATAQDIHRSPLLASTTGLLRSSPKALEEGTALALALGLRGGEDEPQAADGEEAAAAEAEARAAAEARQAQAEAARAQEAAQLAEEARAEQEAAQAAERARAERAAAAAKADAEARLAAARKRKRMLLTAAAATAALATGGSVTLGKVLQKEPDYETELDEPEAPGNPEDLWLDRQIDKLI